MTPNIPHSILARLKNRATENREDFNVLLSRYGMERFLYRLSISAHRDTLILKGASLFLVWKGHSFRVTRDADMLATTFFDPEKLETIFREICLITCTEDGMIYNSESLKTENIREGRAYQGIRISLVGLLNRVRIPIQIDIGFGDAVTPAPEEIEYPTILENPSPKLKAYPRETLLAEKFEAIITLGIANSRMKDFYDIWLLSKLFSFDGEILCSAIRNTFSRRNTPLPVSKPAAFMPDFYEEPQKRAQWKAFITKSKPELVPGDFSSVIEEISSFLLPITERLQSGSIFKNDWSPEDGWFSRKF